MIGLLATAAHAGVGVGDAPGLDATAAPRRVALVVGLNEYPADPLLHDLQFAAADALAVGDLLSSAGYAVDQILTASDPETFWSQLSDTTATLHSQDLFLLFFAGHAQLRSEGLDDELQLLFSDSLSTDPSAGISLEALAAAIDAVPANQRVVILDACYSERTAQLLAQRRGGSQVAMPDIGRFDAWIYAAAPQQSAQEDPALGHGIFTHFLLEALSGAGDLDGNGHVELLETYSWVGEATARYTGGAQVPQLEEKRIGWQDLPLISGGDGVPSRAVLPWSAQGSGVLLLDGTPRGPGAIQPGRYTLELYDHDDTLLLRRKVQLDEGDVLAWEPMLHSTRTRVFLAAGAGMGSGQSGLLPQTSGHVMAWIQPSSPRSWRLAVGATGWGGRGSLADAEDAFPIAGGLLRAGLWSHDGAVVIGPTLGGGLMLRWPAGQPQAATALAPGMHVHIEPRRLIVSADAAAIVLRVDDAWQPLPELRLSLGLRL